MNDEKAYDWDEWDDGCYDWDETDEDYDWCEGCPFAGDPWECACCTFINPDADPWDI